MFLFECPNKALLEPILVEATAAEKDTKLEASCPPIVQRLAALWSPNAHKDPLWRALTDPEPPEDLPDLFSPAAEEVLTSKPEAISEPDFSSVVNVSDVRPQLKDPVMTETSRSRAARGTQGCFGGRYPPQLEVKPEKHAEFQALKTGYAQAAHDEKLAKPKGSCKANNTSGAQSRYLTWVNKRIHLLKGAAVMSDLEHGDWVSQAVEEWRTICLDLQPRSRAQAEAAATAWAAAAAEKEEAKKLREAE